MFWSPEHQPRVVRLVPAGPDDEPLTSPFALSRLDGVDLREAEDGWHGLWRKGGVTHQFWIRDGTPADTQPYAVKTPFDDFYLLRGHAAERLWRALKGRPPGDEFRKLPKQRRDYHVLCLRVLDAKLAGVSDRKIGEVMFGFRGSKEDWEVDRCKSQVRRLVAKGRAMMGDGYKSLLHYPLKSDT